MQLQIIGHGAAYPGEAGVASSSYLVTDGETRLVLDLGQGSFANLAATLDPATLSAVLVSHLHPDHFVDLVALRHYLRYEFDPPARVQVLGPAGLADRLDGLHAETGFATVSLDFPSFGEGTRVVGTVEVEARLVTHTKESYAFRVSHVPGAGPPTPGLVYSGDCGRADDLVALVRPGDTLLCEVAFGPDPVPEGALHLNARDVAGLAAATGVTQLLLTHLQMRHDPVETIRIVRSTFRGPVSLVRTGDRFEI